MEVRSALSNHYKTIPTEYRGEERCGLFGPVRIETKKCLAEVRSLS